MKRRMRTLHTVLAGFFLFMVSTLLVTSQAFATFELVPIIGASLDRKKALSIDIGIGFERRADDNGLRVFFKRGPSQFSHFVELPIETAIKIGARIAGMEEDAKHWTIRLAVPYYGDGFQIYGTSCAPMIVLTILAMAKGDQVYHNRVITGEVLDTGEIGPVDSIHLKLLSSEVKFKSDLHPFEKILIPIKNYEDVSQNPFLTRIIFVSNLEEAYFELTGRLLKKTNQ